MLFAICILLSADVEPTTSKYVLKTMAGEILKCNSLKTGVEGALIYSSDKSIGADEWYSISQKRLSRPPYPKNDFINLANGDVIRGELRECDGDAILWRLSLAKDAGNSFIRIPMSAALTLWKMSIPDNEHLPDWMLVNRKRDILQLKNGDTVEGSISAIDPAKKLKILTQSGEQKVDFTSVSAIGFNSELVRNRMPKGKYYRLTLIDGSRVTVTNFTIEEDQITAMTDLRSKFILPMSAIASIDVEKGKAVWLSDLKPLKYVYQTFDGEKFDWIANRAVTGKPMQLQADRDLETYDRGLGLHASCSISYQLNGKYRRFETLAGLDANSGKKGNLVLKILLDGKPVSISHEGKISFAGGNLAIAVPVANVKELTITVDAGAGGHVQDHLNLANAILIP